MERDPGSCRALARGGAGAGSPRSSPGGSPVGVGPSGGSVPDGCSVRPRHAVRGPAYVRFSGRPVSNWPARWTIRGMSQQGERRPVTRTTGGASCTTTPRMTRVRRPRGLRRRPVRLGGGNGGASRAGEGAGSGAGAGSGPASGADPVSGSRAASGAGPASGSGSRVDSGAGPLGEGARPGPGVGSVGEGARSAGSGVPAPRAAGNAGRAAADPVAEPPLFSPIAPAAPSEDAPPAPSEDAPPAPPRQNRPVDAQPDLPPGHLRSRLVRPRRLPTPSHPPLPPHSPLPPRSPSALPARFARTTRAPTRSLQQPHPSPTTPLPTKGTCVPAARPLSARTRSHPLSPPPTLPRGSFQPPHPNHPSPSTT